MHDGPEGSGEKEEVVLGISSFSESEGGRRVGVRGKTPLSRSMDQDRGGLAVVHWTISQTLSFLGFSLAGPNGVRGITSATCGERGVPDFGSRNCKLFHSAPLTI